MKTIALLLTITLAFAGEVQGQFNYTINNGTITITGYTGPGGDVSIPGRIGSLPVVSIGSSAFYLKYTVTGVYMPDSVTSIGQAAFEGCSGMRWAVCNGVTDIGVGAFYLCTLQEITLGTNLTSIGQAAFESTGLTNITLPNSVTDIGEFAFYGNGFLTNVTIGTGVTSIGDGAFAICPRLQAITVDPANSSYCTLAGVLFNKSQTTLVEYLADKTGAYTIPSSVTSIGDEAFFFCTSLTNVTIPASVTNIGESAFYNCTDLTGVIIPRSVTSLGEAAFGACTNLARVYFQGNAPSANGSVFSFDTNTTVYYLPGTTGWAAFSANTGLTPVQYSGSLEVSISPPGAVSAGAQWQVDSGAWQASGSVVYLFPGNHTIAFTTIGGWTTPTNQAVTVNLNQTTTATATYVQQFGNLQVVLSPAGAVSEGAQWQVDGGAWQNSGATVSALPVGSHTTVFKPISGWSTPASQVVAVAFNQTTADTATYLPPHTATATAVLTNGFVVAITIMDDGGGYTNTPLVQILGGGGSGAQAVAVVSNGLVTAVNILNPGSGYTNMPMVVIQPPCLNPVLSIAAMSFLAFSNLTVGGVYQPQRLVAWYWSNQLASFTATNTLFTQTVEGAASSGDYRLALSPVPAQAYATAEVSYGFVVGAMVTSGGSGYVTTPAVAIAGGGGTNAGAVANVSGGVVTSLTMTNPGIGYTSTPTIRIAPPPAAAVSPVVLPMMRLDSANLAPYDNYQIQFKPGLDRTWGNWNGGLFSPTDVTNSQYVFITNGVGFFRLQHLP